MSGTRTVRVVLTGPECTGKTTLTADVAREFNAPWLPEAARVYADKRGQQGHVLSLADVEPIARQAIAAEDAALAAKPPLLVLDTDLLSTVAYSRHYYGTSSAWLEGEARARRAALYLLCAPDIPWSADGIRDRPGDRAAMFAHFENVLTEFGAHFIVIRGLGEARIAAAIQAVAALRLDDLPRD